MKIIYNRINPFTYNSVCALGNFDGIHKAHQEIIKKVKDIAGKERKTGIITFQPPPVSVLHKNGIFFLTTKEEKEKILEKLGIDFIFYFKFDKRFAQSLPDKFVNTLYEMVKPAVVVVGENFHFGRERQGNAKLLKELARGKFSVEIVLNIMDQEGLISSTRIRELLLLGHIPQANQILGREYSITGQVIKGKGKGVQLGFPTINLSVDREKLLPLDGVYEVKLEIKNIIYKGAMFLGHNRIEVHILKFNGNLYKQKITVQIIRRLRAIKNFSDDESLKRAIAGDISKIIQ
uniref:Riboflavin biosynthesis protein n=1 Tax=candidate division WOR-3 bacterium TaxID=2052148 RepID=A0A7C4X9U7_UNCW3